MFQERHAKTQAE